MVLFPKFTIKNHLKELILGHKSRRNQRQSSSESEKSDSDREFERKLRNMLKPNRNDYWDEEEQKQKLREKYISLA